MTARGNDSAQASGESRTVRMTRADAFDIRSSSQKSVAGKSVVASKPAPTNVLANAAASRSLRNFRKAPP